MTIADTGENARQLLASVSRRPGSGRVIGVKATSDRQIESIERITTAVRRDLGPTANIRELGDKIIETARKEAKPLYKASYERPGASAFYYRQEEMLKRPSLQKGLKNAVKTAQEEGIDPKTLGFAFDDAGDVVVESVPSWQTMDAIKRGLDDVVEKNRDSVTGKLVLKTGQDRAIAKTRDLLRERMKSANPEYAAALKAYSGNAQMKDALNKGFKALSKSPDDIAAQMKGMGPTELEMYRTGLRKAIIDKLEGKGDFADKVAALQGTPRSRKILTKVFGGEAKFNRFIKTLGDEREMGLTYKAVNTGSPTAKNINFDETTSAEGLFNAAADIGEGVNRGGAIGGFGKIINRIREAGQLGSGKAGDKARESIAALLSETHPDELRAIIIATRRAAAKQRLGARNAIKRSRIEGGVSGRSIGSSSEDFGPK